MFADAVIEALHIRLHHHLSAHVAVSVSLALASSLAFALAIVAQQRAAERVPDEHARSGRLIRQLIRSRQWIAGTVSNTLGYGLQGVALAYGSLLIVQPILVTSLLFAMPLEARLSRARLPRSQWAWAAALAAGLAVFVSTGNPNHGADHGSRSSWLIAGLLVAPLVLICLAAARRLDGARRASMLATAVGLLGGVLAVLTKGVVSLLRHGITLAVTSWELYALLVVGIGGAYLQQLSFQAGPLQASWPIIIVLEPLVATALGLTLLHEKLRVNSTHLLVLAATCVVMVSATVILARGQALLEDARRARHSAPSPS